MEFTLFPNEWNYWWGLSNYEEKRWWRRRIWSSSADFPTGNFYGADTVEFDLFRGGEDSVCFTGDVEFRTDGYPGTVEDASTFSGYDIISFGNTATSPNYSWEDVETGFTGTYRGPDKWCPPCKCFTILSFFSICLGPI